MLINELELGVLWDEYGLVGDVVVNHFYFFVLFCFALRLVSTTGAGVFIQEADTCTLHSFVSCGYK
jgi:hypothetical protein